MSGSATKRLACWGTAGALALGTAGLGVLARAPTAVGDDADSVVFHVGFGADVDSFNPFLGIKATSYEMWALMYDSLITYSMKDMSPQPGLAASWDTSDDGLTWTFHMRDGVTWSDGEALTADDVAFTYNRILDGGPESTTWRSYLKSIDTITAPDERTVQLKLAEPNAVLPLLPMPILPEHVWSDISEEEVKSYPNEPQDGNSPVGSGPFRLVEGTAGGSTYRFEANADYWQGAPNFDEVDFTVFKNADTQAQALIKGDIDFAEDLSALQLRGLDNEDGITTVLGDSPGFDEIAFNTGAVDTDTGEPIGDGNPVLKDPKFRYALGFAVDLDQIISKVYQGAGTAGDTIIPDAYSTYHWEPPDDVAFSYDPERAGQLLDDAGYTMGPDGVRTMPDGSPIGTLRLTARDSSPTSLDTLEFFHEWLDDIGIASEVETMGENKLTDVIIDGDYDIFQWGWYVEPDPDSILSYLSCGQLGGWSDSWYCNEDYDALYDAQHKEMDPTARAETVKQMQQMVFMDAPYLVTAYSKIGEAYRSDRFGCFTAQPDPGGVLLIQYGVYNYVHAAPVGSEACPSADGSTTASSSSAGSGVSMAAVVIGALVVVGLLAALSVVAVRRRATSAGRE